MEPSRTVREEFMSAFGDQVTVSRAALVPCAHVGARWARCWQKAVRACTGRWRCSVATHPLLLVT